MDSQNNQLAVAQSGTNRVYDRVGDPIEFAKAMAKGASLMLGAPPDQGPAIAMAAFCEGLTIVEMARRYHWIQGRPSMRADAMLAEFRLNHGGKYIIKERTPDAISIQFIDKDGNDYVAATTWEEMQQSRWPWRDWKKPAEERELKDAWATPMDRRAMMFARTVSDALRAICPELTAGVYTPEEMADVTPVAQEAIVAPTVEQIVDKAKQQSQKSEVVATTEITTAEVAADPGPASSAIENARKADEPQNELSHDSPGSINDRTRESIASLFESLGITAEKQEEILAKRNASVLHNLSQDQGKEILDRLQALKAQAGN
jgi:hypothetical protein